MGLWDICAQTAPVLSADIDGFVAESLAPAPTVVKEPKIVHDAVHGTHMLEGWEVAILDTPLMQRLRHIHQTSNAYLTYPSARHDRFQHSIGVRMGAERIMRQISLRQSAELTQEQRVNVQLAALTHDLGHGFGSHISEALYGLDHELAALKKLEFLAQASPHERLSFLIVLCPAFRAYVRQLADMYGFGPIDHELVGRFIVGSVDNPSMYYLGEIINGPFDADKMDYFLRDSRFTGIPLAVDIDRLLAFVEVAEVNPAKEVEELLGDADLESQLRDRDRVEKHLVVGVRGITAVEQMIFNRFMLTSSVYQHHKVRAADRVMIGLAQRLRDVAEPVAGHDLHRVVSFLRVSDAQLLNHSSSDAVAADLANRLRNRALPKRALVLSRTTVAGHNSMFHTLAARGRQGAAAREAVEEAIWEEAAKVNPQIWREHVWLDFPDEPKYSDARRCLVRLRKGRYSLLSDLAKLGEMKESFSRSKFRAHVFATEEHRGVVADAATKVLEATFEVRLLPSARSEAKLS